MLIILNRAYIEVINKNIIYGNFITWREILIKSVYTMKYINCLHVTFVRYFLATYTFFFL